MTEVLRQKEKARRLGAGRESKQAGEWRAGSAVSVSVDGISCELVFNMQARKRTLTKILCHFAIN